MQEIEKQVRNIMVKVLRIKETEISTHASRENSDKWDSLAHMNLMLAMEEKFGIEFEDVEIVEIASLSALIESIRKKCS